MVCRHLEQLSRDIKAQGISENPVELQNTKSVGEAVSVDCYLDRKSIRQKHNFPDFVTNYTASETETTPVEGFICNQCNQAVIGLHQGFMPGCKSFGYNDTGDPYVFYFDDTSTANDQSDRKIPPIKKPKQRRIGFIIFAILLGAPISLYQVMPHNMKLGFAAGICVLILLPFLVSPVTQKIRRKDRYAFPFANIVIIMLIGLPIFVLYGWEPVYYFLGGYVVLVFFGSIILRLTGRKA